MKIGATIDLEDILTDDEHGAQSVAEMIKQEIRGRIIAETRTWAKENVVPLVRRELAKQYPLYKDSVIAKAVSIAMKELEVK